MDARPTGPVVLFGATGYTGRLLAAAAARAGLEVVLGGRDRAGLEAVAQTFPTPPALRIADVGDRASLAALVEGARVCCSTVGPFTELGPPVLEACLDAGVHYLDSTGEQPWMARVYDDYDARAKDAGIVACPAMAFEVAVADCAAAMAAAALDTVDEVSVVYALHGFGTSRGTRASALTAVARGGWQHLRGARTAEPPAAQVRTVSLPGGGEATVASFPSGEVLTVPRHLDVAEVRTWLQVPRAAARVLSPVGPALPALARGPLGRLARFASDRLPRGPGAGRRQASRGRVLAIAHGTEAGARAAVTVSVPLTDPYGLTGEILVAGARRLLERPPAPGARTPAEVAGDPEAFLKSLGLAPERRGGDVGV